MSLTTSNAEHFPRKVVGGKESVGGKGDCLFFH